MTAYPALLRSALPSMAFPALPGGSAAAVTGILFQLEQTQWWPRARLEAAQEQQLALLLRHAWEQCPFWRRRLEAAGYAPGAAAALEVLHALPPLTRGDLQAHGPDLRARSLPPGHGGATAVRTSGSTGKPVEVLATEVTGLLWHVMVIRDHLWFRRDFSGRLAAIRWRAVGDALPPDGIERPGWGGLLEELWPTGPAGLLNSASDVPAQARWLRRQDPHYLLSHPSNLMALARHALDAGLPLPRLHQIRTVGEPVTPALREACDAAWGVPVADVYSCQEVGYLAAQCPAGGGYHALAETVLLEVVRDDGTAAAPGETGRVLVTSLHNFATPLIRYALGDYATVGGPCACGRGLPLLERIDGRVRNMLRYPDGRRAWPSLRMSRFAEVADVRQVQVVQHALDGLELKVVPGGPLAPGAESALRAVVQEQLGHPFRVEVTRHESIPRGAGGKFEDFQSRLPEAP